ncbi:predicted protein [Lichtheimia corymbifera JMRC:FSU:9682]|uniref:Uncharacterized protein n=1 Tax=Lichtheimia corymbifera JMRC:FSU:9682 TaxID=1263082 RepID=A0A068RVC7_9FUNG|nr:predicted protein [Lichtheimia corymbifera JMRC:FSU:9682]
MRSKFHDRGGQSLGRSRPSIVSAISGPFAYSQNEACGFNMNRVDRHDAENLLTKFQVRNGESQHYVY